MPSGAIKQIADRSYVALLVVEVDEVWSPACREPYRSGGRRVDGSGSGQPVRGQLDSRSGRPLAPVSAFGHEGHHLVVEVPEELRRRRRTWPGQARVLDGRYYQDNGKVVEYWFLDVEGTPVMVEANWFPGSSPEEDVAELQAVLDTLVITP